MAGPGPSSGVWKNPLPASATIDQEIIFESLSAYLAQTVVQSGTFTATFTAAAAVTGTLTFPTPFNTSPNVVATVSVGANLDININWTAAPSATSVPWRAFQNAAAAVTGTATVFWVAVGT